MTQADVMPIMALLATISILAIVLVVTGTVEFIKRLRAYLRIAKRQN